VQSWSICALPEASCAIAAIASGRWGTASIAAPTSPPLTAACAGARSPPSLSRKSARPPRVITVDRKGVEAGGRLNVEAPKNRKFRRTIYPRYPIAEPHFGVRPGSAPWSGTAIVADIKPVEHEVLSETGTISL
jgi:hypothetical protein